MKIIYKIRILIFSLVMAISLWSCDDLNDEYVFVHDTNTISQMVCRATHTAGEFRGYITEFDKNEERIVGDFTQEEVEGGYGVILFEIPNSLGKDVDLTNVYLIATVSYDVFITPTLTGRHDITGDGIIITVKSGVGTTRQYRVRGYYE